MGAGQGGRAAGISVLQGTLRLGVIGKREKMKNPLRQNLPFRLTGV